jgi:hypothetical protein
VRLKGKAGDLGEACSGKAGEDLGVGVSEEERGSAGWAVGEAG